MHGLYAIIDLDALSRKNLDPLRFAAAVAEAEPAAMQLRDKRHEAAATLELLRALRPLTRARGILLFANDRPDLAALADCDGVHLGQDDLPAAEARKVMQALGGRAMMVGMSVHDGRELERALAQAPDYLAFGPVFGTQSKARPAPSLGLSGLEALTSAARAHTKAPFVAIGSIDEKRAPGLSCVEAIAVISALVGDEADAYAAATTRARALQRAFGGGRR